MKKVLISILIILTLILLGTWGYLLLNGAPQNIPFFGEPFSPPVADVVGTPTETGEEEGQDQELAAIDPTQDVVRLSSRQVAGAIMLERDGASYVRYAEQGTGRIYEVSLTDGTTSLVSNTVVPRTVAVSWSPTGTRLAFTSELTEGLKEVFVGTIIEGVSGERFTETFSLGTDVENVAFLDTGDALYYTKKSAAGSAGYRYELPAGPETEVFEAPFAHATVLWDTAGTGVHYLYTAPTNVYRGFLYAVTDGTLSYVMPGAPGLSASRLSDGRLLVSEVADGEIQTHTLSPETGELGDFALPVVPEKCVSGAGENTICAAPIIFASGSYPDPWHQGRVSFDDVLWSVDESGATLLKNPELKAGMPLDIIDLSLNDDASRALVKNKTDRSLWLVRLK